MIRRLKSDEQGQAIIIAAVGMLIMAVGVLATAQMGFAIFEKQKLQTIADANAYSLATMQARAFNLIAFTNRAQVVHYVVMMHMQAIISSLTLMEWMFGMAADIFYEMCRPCQCPCPYGCQAACLACGVYTPAEMARYAISTTIGTTPGMGLDYAAYAATIGLQELNTLLGTAQKSFRDTMGAVSMTGLIQLLRDSDPDIDPVSRLITGVINMSVWTGLLNPSHGLFDRASESLPMVSGASDDAKKAQRLMAETANATRTGFISKRDVMKLPGLGGLPVGLSPTTGQTKLVTDQKKEKVEESRFYDSNLAEGIAMSSIDYVQGLGAMQSVGVEHAPQQKGKHYRYKKYADSPEPPPSCLAMPLRIPPGEIKEASNDTNHNNWNSPSKYVSLNPANVKEWKRDFGQPGVIIWLNKKTGQLTRDGLTQKFRMDAPTWQSEINTRIGEKGALSSLSFTGINAIAAAQVYYHRPGNWKEQPNLFNPFWKARLYPVTNYVQFATSNGLPPVLATLIQNMLVIH